MKIALKHLISQEPANQMPALNITPEHPSSLTIAADARLCPINLKNDQIWEFKLNNNEAPLIALETTYGLRARLCRIFPSFTLDDKVVNNPADFTHPVIIHRYFPNFLEISFKPFVHINVRIEYWVPNSHIIAGRIRIFNSGHSDCNLQMEWSVLLLPSSNGSRMAINEVGKNTLLAGQTSDLYPIMFLTGGAQPGKSPYPSLSLSLSISSKEEKTAQWAHVSMNDLDSSFVTAKEVCAKNWDAEFARINRINENLFEIHTGNKDWDVACSLSQVIAFQLFLQNNHDQKNKLFVKARRPDRGYSASSDGFSQSWEGLSALDSFHLLNYVLPNSPDLTKYLIDSFLETQNTQGEIESKLGVSGLSGHLLAAPIFAQLAVRLYEISPDDAYIKDIFPKLITNFNAWFTSLHDRDGDHVPEWDQTAQTCFEDRLIFSNSNSKLIGMDISTVECPDLISYLFRECRSLIDLALLIDDDGSIGQLISISQGLKSMVEETWSDQSACYHYRDRDTHKSSEGELIAPFLGEGVLEIQREFDPPIRPVFRINLSDDQIPAVQIYIHGSGASGIHRVENIQPTKIRWSQGFGNFTSDYSYSSLERIEFMGIRPQDSITLSSVDLSMMDLSLTTPVWAEIPSREKVKIIINLSLMNRKRFLSPHGFRSYIDIPDNFEPPAEFLGLNMVGNAMLLDGFTNYGERKKAAEVFQRLMNTIILSLDQDLTFHSSYDAENGRPIGAPNSIRGLVPVSLFLKILGVKIYHPFRVEIDGTNPFPWPVTIKYQGLTVIKHETKSLIIFPDGSTINVHNDKKQLISRE